VLHIKGVPDVVDGSYFSQSWGLGVSFPSYLCHDVLRHMASQKVVTTCLKPFFVCSAAISRLR